MVGYYLWKRCQQTENVVQASGTSISLESLTGLRRKIKFKDEENILYEDCYDMIPDTRTSVVKIDNEEMVTSIFMSKLPPIPKITLQFEEPELQSCYSTSSVYEAWDAASELYENSAVKMSKQKLAREQTAYVNSEEYKSDHEAKKYHGIEQLNHLNCIPDTEYDVWWENEETYVNDSQDQAERVYSNLELTHEVDSIEDIYEAMTQE